MFLDKDTETMPKGKLKSLQSERLASLVAQLYDKVPFYRERMDAKGVRPESIRSTADLFRLPFTTKDDLRGTYPYGLLACPPEDLVEIHMSSGTTGTPVVGGYTRPDIELWGEVMGRTLSMGGATSADVVHNAYGYGLFTGGMGAHYGARRVGANVIPVSGGNTQRQLMILKDFHPTILCCTPSYCLHMADAASEHGVDLSSLHLKAGFFGAEPWSQSMRMEIESKFHIKAYDIYGLTEIIGPGVAAECQCQDGLHVFEDHFFPEIIDPVSGDPLPDGAKGELVFTTLTRQGTPILRYRTRDITYIIPEPCPCGRVFRRISRLLGRTDDMLIIRGVNVFPSQIEQILLRVEKVEPHYQLILERKEHLDHLEVQVEMNESLFSDEMRRLEALERHIESELRSALGIQAKVRLVNPKSIPRSEGKAKRIIDKRNLDQGAKAP